MFIFFLNFLFFATKERIPLKLTMEYIDVEELNENKTLDEDFLMQRVPTVIGNELENENNFISMNNDEKKKKLSKTEINEAKLIIDTVKYENEQEKKGERKKRKK